MKTFAAALISSSALAVSLTWEPEPVEHVHHAKEEVTRLIPRGTVIGTELVDVEREILVPIKRIETREE